ncbi:hypothetical protein HPB47_028131 [Ixodes persulcatus]|uniref:Uncharacterized protein n=1 Tax=Ixodes persulcatus TaxID=34615 RepID=A0AC60PVW8_IXOPE|nr:hypothetical protein HPB47_028131 [Ixodes persulcatus]
MSDREGTPEEVHEEEEEAYQQQGGQQQMGDGAGGEAPSEEEEEEEAEEEEEKSRGDEGSPGEEEASQSREESFPVIAQETSSLQSLSIPFTFTQAQQQVLLPWQEVSEALLVMPLSLRPSAPCGVQL